MKHDSLEYQTAPAEVGVYECEVRLKFRMIEEKGMPHDRESLIEMLLEAYSYGCDEFLEPIQVEASAAEISELEASPEMRRQLIRLRNARELG
jgi:Npun R1517